MTVTAIDDVPLNDSDGRWSVLDESDFIPALGSVQPSTALPGMDGVLPGLLTIPPPEQSIALLVSGDDEDTVRSYCAALTRMFRRGSTLTRSVAGGTQQAACSFKTMQPVAYWPDGTATMNVTMRLTSVVWRGASADWTQSNPSSGTAYEVTTLANTTAPVDDALILVTGPAPSPRIHCFGEYIDLNLTVAAGEKALIDCANWTARHGTGVTFAGGGSLVSGRLSNSGTPYLLRLVPRPRATDPTNTRVQVAISSTGMSSATKLQIRARPADVV